MQINTIIRLFKYHYKKHFPTILFLCFILINFLLYYFWLVNLNVLNFDIERFLILISQITAGFIGTVIITFTFASNKAENTYSIFRNFQKESKPILKEVLPLAINHTSTNIIEGKYEKDSWNIYEFPENKSILKYKPKNILFFMVILNKFLNYEYKPDANILTILNNINIKEQDIDLSALKLGYIEQYIIIVYTLFYYIKNTGDDIIRLKIAKLIHCGVLDLRLYFGVLNFYRIIKRIGKIVIISLGITLLTAIALLCNISTVSITIKYWGLIIIMTLVFINILLMGYMIDGLFRESTHIQ